MTVERSRWRCCRPWGPPTPDGEAVIVSAGEALVGRLYRVPFVGDPTVIVEPTASD